MRKCFWVFIIALLLVCVCGSNENAHTQCNPEISNDSVIMDSTDSIITDSIKINSIQ